VPTFAAQAGLVVTSWLGRLALSTARNLPG
jgi:hypothetical protein